MSGDAPAENRAAQVQAGVNLEQDAAGRQARAAAGPTTAVPIMTAGAESGGVATPAVSGVSSSAVVMPAGTEAGASSSTATTCRTQEQLLYIRTSDVIICILLQQRVVFRFH